VEDTGISDSEVKKEISLSKVQQKKIDEVIIRLKTLEESLEQPVKLTIKEMMRKANYNFYRKNYEKAKEIYNQILKKEPENNIALFNFSFSNTRLGNYEKAIFNYNKILENEPDNATVLNNLGFTYSKKGDNKKSLEYYRKAIKSDPKMLLPKINLAAQLQLENNFDGALQTYFEAEKTSPNNLDVLSGIATAYLYKRNYKKAKEYAERGLTIIPKDKASKIAIVVCNLIFGNYIKASELSNELLKEYGDESDILYNYACAEIRQGKKEIGLDLLKKSILMNPEGIKIAELDPDFDSVRNSEEFQKIIKS